MTKKQITALKRIAKRNRKGSVEYARTDIEGHTSFLVTDGYVVVQYDTSIADTNKILHLDIKSNTPIEELDDIANTDID